jgi:hypothetical protein
VNSRKVVSLNLYQHNVTHSDVLPPHTPNLTTYAVSALRALLKSGPHSSALGYTAFSFLFVFRSDASAVCCLCGVKLSGSPKPGSTHLADDGLAFGFFGDVRLACDFFEDVRIGVTVKMQGKASQYIRRVD